jgi:DNA-binding NarL/FixJ family response regulator
VDANTATAVLSALRLAHEHGGAEAALRAAGIDLPAAERVEGLSAELGNLLGGSVADEPAGEALALGFLAGHLAPRLHPRRRLAADPTAFVMDRELVVQGAHGESILRLPWFEEGLFVGRQLPDISEMPIQVRALCVEHYSAALAGEPGQFSFTSYGHGYSVDAVPVRDDDGRIASVLAIAAPARSFSSAAAAYERTAERLDRSAANAERRAERHRVAGRIRAEDTERQAIRKARDAAERARANARRLRSGDTATSFTHPLSLTARETEVLQLASHGFTSAEIAEQLVVSVGTIKTHLQNTYPKLAVSDRAAAVATALRHGLID